MRKLLLAVGFFLFLSGVTLAGEVTLVKIRQGFQRTDRARRRRRNYLQGYRQHKVSRRGQEQRRVDRRLLTTTR